MSSFSPQEIEYFQNQRLGRLATVNKAGEPRVAGICPWYTKELRVASQ